jgi:hypothetical protein
MPLIQSPSKAVIGPNIQREMTANKPRAQAIAIALNNARRNGANLPMPLGAPKRGLLK